MRKNEYVIWTVFFILLLPFVQAHNLNTSLQLATDYGMWAFFLLNVGGWVLAAFLLLKLLGHKYRPPQRLRKKLGFGLTLFFVMVIGYQFFHQIEHVAQVYQYSFLGMPALDAKGILWFFNIEWNHFIFNAGYFVGLIFLSACIILILKKEKELFHAPNLLIIGSLVGIQGWHFLEHLVRIIRHITIGCEPCHGILDSVFGWGLIYLHFVFNTVVLILPLTMFVWFGFHHRLWECIRKSKK